MLKFNKKVEYALIAMLEMAQQANANELITAKSVSSRYHIPQEIMGKVLQTLVKGGLLLSVQGVKGGYTLATHPDRVSIWQVVQAIEGPVTLVTCIGPDKHYCQQYEYCNIRTPLTIIQDKLEEYFSDMKLSDVQQIYRNQEHANVSDSVGMSC